MSKVVFVGNVPYNMGEEQLIDVFKSVGQVIGFRLVFDRETGKPRGYGFCEFADHETAMSAVRNLNNVEVGGRPLRIDLADSDPFLEGKTTVRGELLDGGYPGPSEPRSGWRPSGRGHDVEAFMVNIPPGKSVPKGTSGLDAISQTLASIPPNQLLETLAQMKAFVITHPDQARTLLIRHPQLAYALFQSLLLYNIYNPDALLRMLNPPSGAAGPLADVKRPPPPIRTPPMSRPPMPAPSPHLQPHYPMHPPPPHGMPPFPPSGIQQPQAVPGMGPPPMSAPPSSALFPPGTTMQPPPMVPPYYRGPPPMPPPSGTPMAPPIATLPAPPPQQQPPPPAQSTPEINDSQRAMIMQVLSLSQDQINALPETERSAILQLRTRFMNGLG